MLAAIFDHIIQTITAVVQHLESVKLRLDSMSIDQNALKTTLGELEKRIDLL